MLIERGGKHLFRERLSPSEQTELRIIRGRFKNLKNSYLFGCHFNSRRKLLFLPHSVRLFDFYLSTKKTYSAFLPESRRVDTVASLFVPDTYASNVDKDIDILYVATDSKSKNWERCLDVCEQLLVERPDLHWMAIQTGRAELSSNHPQITELRSKFPDSKFDFRYVQLSGPGKGLANHEIRTFMNRAKVFTHFAEVEGQATVLSEAFMAGCKVGMYRKLNKTSVELPDTANWRLYSEGKESAVILELLDSEPTTASDFRRVLDFFGERSNIRLLTSSVEKIVAPDIPNFENMQNLKHRLPAHTAQGVEWDKEIEYKPSAALRSLSDVKSFLDFLEG